MEFIKHRCSKATVQKKTPEVYRQKIRKIDVRGSIFKRQENLPVSKEDK